MEGTTKGDPREVDLCGADTALKLTPNTLVLDSTMCLFRNLDQIICHLAKERDFNRVGEKYCFMSVACYRWANTPRQ